MMCITDTVNAIIAERDARIAELEAENAALKADAEEYGWKTGHPEHSEEVLVYVKFYEYGYAYGAGAFLGYTVDEWDFQLEHWVGDQFNCTVLGWQEIEPFDLPIEPSETIGHLEEEEK